MYLTPVEQGLVLREHRARVAEAVRIAALLGTRDAPPERSSPPAVRLRGRLRRFGRVLCAARPSVLRSVQGGPTLRGCGA